MLSGGERYLPASVADLVSAAAASNSPLKMRTGSQIPPPPPSQSAAVAAAAASHSAVPNSAAVLSAASRHPAYIAAFAAAAQQQQQQQLHRASGSATAPSPSQTPPAVSATAAPQDLAITRYTAHPGAAAVSSHLLSTHPARSVDTLTLARTQVRPPTSISSSCSAT